MTSPLPAWRPGMCLGIAHIVATSAATFACLAAWKKVALYTWRLLRVRRARRGADRTGFSSPDRCSGALGQSKSRKRLRNRSGAAAACRCALAVRGRRPDARRAPKTAPKTAPAPPRVDFCADVARLLPVEERVYAFDFCGGGAATIWAIPIARVSPPPNPSSERAFYPPGATPADRISARRMSFAAGDSLDGWHLPAVSSPPGAAQLLPGEPFGGLDEGLALAAGDSLDGWHLPAVSSSPGAAQLLLGEPFGGLDEGLALAAGSAHDTDLSTGIHSFFDGSPWLEGVAHGGRAPSDVQVELSFGLPPAGFQGSEELPPRDISDATPIEWRCLSGCAQPCSRCESGAEREATHRSQRLTYTPAPRCEPPPPLEEISKYQLVGDKGAKNGEV